MKRHWIEVETRIRALTQNMPQPKWKAEDYVGGGASQLKYLNLKIPSVRAEYKRGFSFSSQDPDRQWRIWDYIWNHSDIFEVMLLASYWAASRPVEEMFAQRRILLAWLSRVDNWAHSDELSSHYAKLMEHNPSVLTPVFKKWNTSRHPWFKRQSMVGLLFYSRLRKRIPPVKLLLEFIDRHIEDEHYYVQKGVGWALRESWNVHPDATFRYLKKNAARIPPAGWTAATEKLSVADKRVLKALRQKQRMLA